MQEHTIPTQHQDLIRSAYAAFNNRDIAGALATMHPIVQWSKAWEGGYISGHDEIRAYWTRQWSEINPHVAPVEFAQRADGRLEVAVHQTVKDLEGNVTFEGTVRHVYRIEDDLIKTMDIEAPAAA